MAQLVKNLPAMRETWVRSLAWGSQAEGKDYPLQYSGLENSTDCIDDAEGKDYPLQYSGLENSMDCIDHGVAVSDTTERLSLLPLFFPQHRTKSLFCS